MYWFGSFDAKYRVLLTCLAYTTARPAYPLGQSPQLLPGDGWGGLTGGLDPEMARFTSLIDAAGPSPSSVVDELEARDADLEEEVRVRSQDLERRHHEYLASERVDGFEEGVGGCAITTITNADEQASPSVSGLREEERYLHDRVKMYDELTQQLLRFVDGRQTAADENIRRLEETLVTCNVSHLHPCSVERRHQIAFSCLFFSSYFLVFYLLRSGYSGSLKTGSLFTEVHSNQDPMMCLKKGVYMGFCVYRRF